LLGWRQSGQCYQRAKAQRFTRTGSYANRLFALRETVDAQIAFLHDAILAELGCTIRTGLGAGFTTVTFVSVDDHDAILCSLGDGPGWAGIRAARFAAVHARERDGAMDQVGIVSGPHSDDVAPGDSQFDVVVRLARQFTGMTLDATIYVEVESKLFSHPL
jgi:hypothetical protein